MIIKWEAKKEIEKKCGMRLWRKKKQEKESKTQLNRLNRFTLRKENGKFLTL